VCALRDHQRPSVRFAIVEAADAQAATAGATGLGNVEQHLPPGMMLT
jgi:hypothetical protein